MLCDVRLESMLSTVQAWEPATGRLLHFLMLRPQGGELNKSLFGFRNFRCQRPSARRSDAAPGGAAVTPLRISSALTGRP